LVQDAAGVPSGKIHVFPALVSPDDVLRHRAAAYQEVLPDVTKPYILTASRLYPRKGHDIVLRALAFLEQEFPTLHYVYTGDGPSAADLVRLAGDLGITDHVKALGTVRQEVLYALYAQCEVFVMLSREENGDVEGLGLAFAEASLFERPVIAGDTGGVREVVEEGVTGYIVRPTDVLAVANRLRDVLSDPALAARLGREGRRRVSELLDIRKRVFELEPFLG